MFHPGAHTESSVSRSITSGMTRVPLSEIEDEVRAFELLMTNTFWLVEGVVFPSGKTLARVLGGFFVSAKKKVNGMQLGVLALGRQAKLANRLFSGPGQTLDM